MTTSEASTQSNLDSLRERVQALMRGSKCLLHIGALRPTREIHNPVRVCDLGLRRARLRLCRVQNLPSLPSTPETVSLYIADQASTHAAATITRRLISITKAHQAAAYKDSPSSTRHFIVGETLKGIRRVIGENFQIFNFCAKIERRPTSSPGG